MSSNSLDGISSAADVDLQRTSRYDPIRNLLRALDVSHKHGQGAGNNHLIGIDPDGRVHVSERFLMLHDGSLLEQSLKAVAGALIRLPRSKQHRPDRDRLAIRFDQFKRAAGRIGGRPEVLNQALVREVATPP